MRAAAPRPLVIDTHTHILPSTWGNLEKAFGYKGWYSIEKRAGGRTAMLSRDGEGFREIDDSCWSLPRRLADMDRHGVDVQVLSTVPFMFSYSARPADTLNLAMSLNDHIALCTREHPARFVGLGTLPMQSPALAIAELERCKSELGLAGVQIGTHINDKTLGDESLFPIFRKAEELDMAVRAARRNAAESSRFYARATAEMRARAFAALLRALHQRALSRLTAPAGSLHADFCASLGHARRASHA